MLVAYPFRMEPRHAADTRQKALGILGASGGDLGTRSGMLAARLSQKDARRGVQKQASGGTNLLTALVLLRIRGTGVLARFARIKLVRDQIRVCKGCAVPFGARIDRGEAVHDVVDDRLLVDGVMESHT